MVLNIFVVSWVMPRNILDTSLLKISRVGTPQRGNLESYSSFLNVEHLERKEWAPLGGK
jgi:hypothetical protein